MFCTYLAHHELESDFINNNIFMQGAVWVQAAHEVVALAGFHIKRQEFEPEYDNEAEMIVADMEFRDDDTEVGMHACTLLSHHELESINNIAVVDASWLMSLLLVLLLLFVVVVVVVILVVVVVIVVVVVTLIISSTSSVLSKVRPACSKPCFDLPLKPHALVAVHGLDTSCCIRGRTQLHGCTPTHGIAGTAKSFCHGDGPT